MLSLYIHTYSKSINIYNIVYNAIFIHTYSVSTHHRLHRGEVKGGCRTILSGNKWRNL